MFQGASSLSLDAKGRLSVPTRHRDVLSESAAGQLTLTKHPHGCLMLFPRPEWEKFRERIAQLPMSAQWWKRIFLGNAMDVEMDATGRVLISPELRQAAGLNKDAILLGMGNHFELWDKARYEAQEAEAMQGEIRAVNPDPAFFRSFQQTFQQPHCPRNGGICTVAPIAGQEYPGQGDVIKLAQVAEVVISRQSPLARPAERLIQLSLGSPYARLQRRDRAHIGEKVTHIQRLCLVQQGERAVQISLRFTDASHGDAPAIGVLREPGMLSLFLASQQELHGGLQIITLTLELTHSDVHIRRSAHGEAGCAMLPRQL